ncbi:MAG: ArsC family reductase [Gammaproteobacteria bacterium]|nr:ArsC family reductase [Gammaproteobacteria bacterium]
MSIVLYGIKNCDTVKKARLWLDRQQIVYTFHDFRVDGLDKKMLKEFLNHVDWETLLNRRGTTWRKIPEEKKENLNKTKVLELMLEHPTIIKRPVLSYDKNISVGFTEDYYEKIFL